MFQRRSAARHPSTSASSSRTWRRAANKQRRSRFLSFDPLEQRTLMAADTFEIYRQSAIAPVGGNDDPTLEPDIATLGDTVFSVGSRVGAVSTNNGTTWAGVNPANVFPTNYIEISNDGGLTRSGGLIGNQHLSTDAERGLVVWGLEYGPGGITANDFGGVRLAAVRSETDLRTPSSFAQVYHDFTPEDFGYLRGSFLSELNMEISDNFVYMSANVIHTEPNDDKIREYMGSVLWRVSLESLKAGGTIERGVFYSTDVGPIGLVEGAKDVMYGASVIANAEVLVYTWADTEQSVGTFSVTTNRLTSRANGNALDSDGNNWAARIDTRPVVKFEDPTGGSGGTGGTGGTPTEPVYVPTQGWRIQTGFLSGTRLGLMWNSAELPSAGRPLPFVRSLIVDLDPTHQDEDPATVDTYLKSIGEPDLFSTSQAILYPSAAVNAEGGVAVIVAQAARNGSIHQRIYIDDKSPLTLTRKELENGKQPIIWENYAAVTGSGGVGAFLPFGEFFGITADDRYENTWVASGYSGKSGSPEARYVWFGRQRNRPDYNLQGVAFDVLQDSARAGDSVDVNFTVKNEGVRTTPAFTVSFYASADPTITTGDVPLGTYQFTTGLAANTSSGGLSKQFTLPAAGNAFWTTVGSGKYYIGMMIDNADAVTPEYDETDNANLGLSVDSAVVYPADFEGNETRVNAADLGFLSGSRRYRQLGITPVNDVDFYKFNAPFDGRVTANIYFTNAGGNLDLFAYDSTGMLLDSSASTTLDSEQVTFFVTAGEDYFLRADGVGSVVNDYTLTTDYVLPPPDPDPPVTNNTLATATDLGDFPVQQHTGLVAGTARDEDYYVLRVLEAGPLTASIQFDHRYGNLDIAVYDEMGNLLKQAIKNGVNKQSVTVPALADQLYYVRVRGVVDTNVYTLDLKASYPPVYAGDTIIVTGTKSNDAITFTPGTFRNTITVNGVDYTVPASTLNYDFRGGAGTNRLTVNGTANSDTFTSTAANLKFNKYTFALNSISDLSLNGLDGDDAFQASGSRPAAIDGGAGNDKIFGSPNADDLFGGDGDDLIVGGDGNDLLRGGLGNDRLRGGEGSDLLAGGDGDDAYEFPNAIAVQTDRIIEYANQGSDTLEFSTASAAVTVTLANDAQLSEQGSRTIRTNAAGMALNIENVVGTSLNDTLTGNDKANRLEGGEGNDLLTGGKGNDRYEFGAATTVQTDTIVENAGEGIDTVSFEKSSVSVTANLTDAANLALQGKRTVKSAAGKALQLENLIGGSADDVLQGNDAANALTGGEGNDLLAGGKGSDVYHFGDASVNQTDVIVELAGEGTDGLSFASLTNDADGVSIDLRSTGTVIGNHRRRTVKVQTAGQAANLENLTGGIGSDLLVGNSSANKIVGDLGNDVLVGSLGADTLNGGEGEDILIGGRTTHNQAALESILAELVRVQLTFGTRVANISGPNGSAFIGANGTNYLDDTTVLDDNQPDKLTGGATASDWFWANVGNKDVNVDFGGADVLN